MLFTIGDRLHLLISVSFFVHVNTKDLPDYLQNFRCSIRNLKECVIKNANSVIPLVARGDAEYHIPKLSPLELPFVQLITTSDLNINLTNVKIDGIDKMRLYDFQGQAERGLFTNMLKSEKIIIDGQYSANGKISVMPIQGNGNFSMALTNGKYNVTVMVGVYEKQNDKHWRLMDCRLDYEFNNIEFKLDNLFDGNKQLGDRVNDFLNENWNLLMSDFGPGIKKIIISVVRSVFDNFCAMVPIKNILL